MPTELRLPPLADTVTSVKLAAWLKTEGQAVAAGEPIVEVETDKTNVEIEAPAGGVVSKIHVPAGTEGLETGALLAVIDEGVDAAGEAGENIAAVYVFVFRESNNGRVFAIHVNGSGSGMDRPHEADAVFKPH